MIEVIITQRVKVDKCIAQEIVFINSMGIRTEGCCCGHKENYPMAYIKPSSIIKAKELDYNPILDKDVGLFEIKLKSQCQCKINSKG